MDVWLMEHGEETQIPSPELLVKLADPMLSQEKLRRFILQAEVVAFDPEQAKTLKPILRQCIEQYRDSTDSVDLTAVAAAIRKYVALLGRDEISSVGFILDAGHRALVPPEIELEVTKMVVRKLCAVLPQEADGFPELGRQLMDLARTYLNPRLLPRPHYGAIALNSVLGLVLLDDRYLGELFQVLRELRVPWFEQLLIRRAETLKQDLVHRSENEIRRQRENLESLVRAMRDAA